MEKNRKLSECVALCNIVVNCLNEISTETEKERKLIFKALEIENEDAERVEDPKLYGLVLDHEYNAKQLKDLAEEVQSIIKDLEKIKL